MLSKVTKFVPTSAMPAVFALFAAALVAIYLASATTTEPMHIAIAAVLAAIGSGVALVKGGGNEQQGRLQSALDVAQANMMVADAGYNIVYMNESVQKTMEDAESDLREVLPNFDSQRLIGQNIDVFHQNPAHQRGMLDKLTDSYATQITVGARKFDLLATPLFDGGRRTGTVVEWKDITQETRIEEEVDEIVRAAGRGDVSKRLDTAGKEGFFKALSENLNSAFGMISSAIDEANEVMASLAHGTLNRRMSGDYEGNVAALQDNINQTSERLSEIVGSISRQTETISTASSEVATGGMDLSKRTEQQAASLEETTAATTELAATIRQNSDNAQSASGLANEARSLSGDSGEIVSNAVKAMDRIEESSKKISEIIDVIDDIAFQTNLLALNAAVEAARAGEAGKGFAVVASEVRNLAQRSAESSNEIQQLITRSNDEVASGVKLVHEAGNALQKISEAVDGVATVISEISSASSEQAQGIGEVNEAIQSMDEMTQRNAAMVEEFAAAAQSMDDAAREQARQMAFFKLEGNTSQVTAVPEKEYREAV